MPENQGTLHSLKVLSFSKATVEFCKEIPLRSLSWPHCIWYFVHMKPCIAACRPLCTGCQQQPSHFNPVVATTNTSRSCQIFPGQQNHFQFRTTGQSIKGILLTHVMLCEFWQGNIAQESKLFPGKQFKKFIRSFP